MKYFTPLNISMAVNVIVLFALGMTLWMRKSARIPLYHRVTVAYGAIYVFVSVCMAIVAAMSSLKSWTDLSSIQWFVLVCAIGANSGNTVLAFLQKIASKISQADQNPKEPNLFDTTPPFPPEKPKT